jgi:hypothetical protein
VLAGDKMELKNGRVYFASASEWKALNKWLLKKGKRVTNKPWAVELRADNKSACLVQEVEEIPKPSKNNSQDLN